MKRERGLANNEKERGTYEYPSVHRRWPRYSNQRQIKLFTTSPTHTGTAAAKHRERERECKRERGRERKRGRREGSLVEPTSWGHSKHETSRIKETFLLAFLDACWRAQ